MATMTKDDLIDCVYEALAAQNGKASIVNVARHIWENHQQGLKNSGSLFFTWQYDMRWAAQKLRNKGKLKPAKDMPKGIWQIN